MKPKRSLTLSVALSILATQALVGAEGSKKPVEKDPKKTTEKSSAKTPAKGDKAPVKVEEKAPEAKAPEIKDPLAVVEGVEINKAEVEDALNAMMQQRGGSAKDIPEDQKAGAYRMIIEDLIVDKLIAKRSADLKVGDEEVEETFKKATAGAGSEEEIKKEIEKAGLTLEKVKTNIRNSLRQQKWVEDQIKGKCEVADKEADEFYAKNPEQFKSPEQVRASHVLLMVKADATPEMVTEKEKAAKKITERAKKGEDFGALAKELSEDPSAKENGGDLDFFSKEQMVPEFADKAFSMKKDEISDPVRSQYGYHVIKVTGRKEAETITLESAKPKILAFLQRQKKQGEVQKLVESVRKSAEVKINLPEPPAPPAPPAGAEPEVTTPNNLVAPEPIPAKP